MNDPNEHEPEPEPIPAGVDGQPLGRPVRDLPPLRAPGRRPRWTVRPPHATRAR